MSDIQEKVRELMQVTGSDFSARSAAEHFVTIAPEMRTLVDAIIPKLQAEINTLYAIAYSEDEIDELITFFKSPIGQKWIQRSPEINRASMDIGAKFGAEFDRTGKIT